MSRNPALPPTRLPRLVAGLTLLALVALGACSSESSEDPTTTTSPATSQVTTAPATSTTVETTAQPPSSDVETSAPATTATQEHTDESLAAIIAKLTHQGTALTPLPIGLLRNSTEDSAVVVPEACAFIEIGPEPQVRGGAPAAVALTQSGIGVSLVALPTEAEAASMLQRLAQVSSDPQCATYTSDGEQVSITSATDTSSGMNNAVLLTTTESDGTSTSLSGHWGNLIIVANTPEGDTTVLTDLVKQVLAQL